MILCTYILRYIYHWIYYLMNEVKFIASNLLNKVRGFQRIPRFFG